MNILNELTMFDMSMVVAVGVFTGRLMWDAFRLLIVAAAYAVNEWRRAK